MIENPRKGTPFSYKRIWNRSCFTLHNQRELYIKHSDAVAFDLQGNTVILSLFDICWPKRVDKETWETLQGHCDKYDQDFEIYK